jgi:hypothetical protein
MLTMDSAAGHSRELVARRFSPSRKFIDNSETSIAPGVVVWGSFGQDL